LNSIKYRQVSQDIDTSLTKVYAKKNTNVLDKNSQSTVPRYM